MSKWTKLKKIWTKNYCELGQPDKSYFTITFILFKIFGKIAMIKLSHIS